MREQRLCYSSPAADIDSGVTVCVGFMSTGCTPKHGLTGAVFLVNMSAHRALAAGMTGVNNDNRNAMLAGFVFDKATQFSESPVMQSFPLLFIGLSPSANMLEVFKAYRALGAFCFGNDATRDVVVNPLLKTALSAAHFLEPSSRGSCSFLLQSGSALLVPLAIGFYVFSAELFARGIRSDVDDPHINPKNPLRSQQIGIVEITDRSDIPASTNEHQIDFAFAVLQQATLMVAANIPDLNASVQRPDRNVVIGNKPKNPLIVGLRAQRAKNTLRFLIELVGISDFGNTAHGDLRGQVKAIPRRLVDQLVQIKLPERFCVPRLLRNPVTGGVALFQRLLEQFCLFGRRLQFDVSDKFHISSIETLLTLVNPKKLTVLCTVPLSLPGINAGVSRGESQ